MTTDLDVFPRTRRPLSGLLLLLAAMVVTACAGEESPSSTEPPSHAEPQTLGVADLTGVHTRVVWVQSESSDPVAQAEDLILMGLDTLDGHGERVILGERRNYTKPLFTPAGDRVVFSRRQSGDLFIVNWDGTGMRRLGEGFALTLWTDPSTGDEWVYVALDRVDEGTHRRVVRFPIDDSESSEPVWDKTPVSEDSFQVSADGRLAVGLFPWPAAGVAELPNGSWRKLGDGCWTALAEAGRSLCWYLDGAHRNLTLVDLEDDRRWQVTINRVPGFTGAEVYHPRWTSDPGFLTITGPYDLGGVNQVRSGGPQVEVYLGRFSTDFTRVDQWVRVTDNDYGDAYPDVWIDPVLRESLPPPSGGQVGNRSIREPGPSDAQPSDQSSTQPLVVEARLITPGTIPSPRSILPYRHALVVSEYEVVQVLEGRYSEDRLLVAQWAIRDGRVLSDARRTSGTQYRLTLELYDVHPELEGERLVMDVDDPDLTIYYDTGS